MKHEHTRFFRYVLSRFKLKSLGPDTVKMVDFCLVWIYNNAVVFANIQTSALWKKRICQQQIESTSFLWVTPSFMSHF